jgi:hypothetical protein
MILLFLPSHAFGADFYLAMNSCTTVVGFPEESAEGVQVYNSTRYIASCTRAEDNVTCDVVFEDNSKSNKVNYRVVMETPLFLHLEAENESEYVAIHKTNHAVVALTRAVDEKFLAGKLCQGVYGTKLDFDALKER